MALNTKFSVIAHPLALLLPLFTGTTACTTTSDLIAPKTTTVSSLKQNSYAVSNKNLNNMLDLAQIKQEKAIDITPSLTDITSKTSKEKSLPDTCFVKIDCPKDQPTPDLTHLQTPKYAKDFLLEEAPALMHRADEEENFTQHTKTLLDGKNTDTESSTDHKDNELFLPQIYNVPISSKTTQINNPLIQFVELWKDIFSQIDQHSNLQAENKTLLKDQLTETAFLQYTKNSQSLEMLQDNSHHAIQSWSYVGYTPPF
ncbi:hypothetical protein [Thiothrix fructosivorans]|uniref:Lipoprotein n=1 Tax=Thiothrix fructosivorans TaxID=111770 RepID=A0A8B0SL26_9GAMM|nr:hypothetical protein [Thiothrix fructosivorans]MBO0614816.1 hypothetical protein [Thiothrix fructosivorans]QTX09632.1 hypothetical protein J1836_013500 [Thiothrix fructosivorans]